MTAEFAVALPAVLVVLAVVVGAVGVAGQQIRLVDATGLVARSAASGDASAGARAEASLPGARFTMRRDGEVVCVTARRPARAAGVDLGDLDLTASSCALAGPLP